MFGRVSLLALGILAVTSPAMGQTLRVALNQDLRSSEPGVNRDGNTDVVMTNVVEGLVSYDKGGAVKPLLAESYQISPDGKTYTFKLRKGVKFHNGNSLTSADVVWNFDRYMNPKTNWYCLNDFNGTNGTKVVSYSAPDADTFLIQLEKPDALFLDSMARTDCGGLAIIDKASLKADGTWDKPIGTGPFTFGVWKQGQSVQFDAFKGYVSPPGKERDGFIGNKAPLVDHVVFMAIPDGATVKAGLESGEIDMAIVPESDVKELRANKNLAVEVGTTPVRNSFILQTRDPVLKDVRIRQALAISLDYQQIVDAVTDGLGRVNNSPVFDTSGYFGDVEKKGFEYNPEKARQLLKEAGYNGQQITVHANKRSTVPSFPMTVLAQQMWQAVGLNVNIEILDWPTQLSKYGVGGYMMQSTSYSPRFDVASGFEQISGDKDKQPRKVWDNPEALALIDKAMETLDPNVRQPIFDKLHTMLLNDVPIILTHNRVSCMAHGAKVQGVEPTSFSYGVWGISKKD